MRGSSFAREPRRRRSLSAFVNDEMLKGGKKKIRLDSGVGVKPISITGSKRLVRAAIQYALDHGRKTVTLVHKGNIQKFTEGAFREWGYEVATQEFRADTVTERESWILGNVEENPKLTPEENAAAGRAGHGVCFEGVWRGIVEGGSRAMWLRQSGRRMANGQWKKKILVNDRIADSIFQQIIIRPSDYSVLATTNLNGDYISDAAAAQVGGLGIAPGANIGDGFAVFEATHGTAPKYADKDVINPGSVMLSGVMLFDFIGWT